MIFRAMREGAEVFASKARSGPTPLRFGTGESMVAVLSGPALQSRVDYRCPIWDEKNAQYGCQPSIL